MGNRSTRLNRIVNILKEQRNVTVRALSEQLGVSEMTVRRDLNTLKADNLIDHIYGRAVYRGGFASPSGREDYELHTEQIKHNAEKDAIGKFAAGMIEPGDILIVDTGSTTDKLARYVPENQDITVLCYNFNILAQMVRKEGVSVIFAGGYFHASDQMFESAQGIELIRNLRANKLFFSASGIHDKLGITCAHSYEVPTKRAVLGSALTRILIADSSKFGNICTAYFAQLSEVDEIVTDSGLSDEWREAIGRTEIKLHIV